MTKRAQQYFEFCILKKSLREEFGLQEYGPEFEVMLEYIAIQNHQNLRLSVKDLMSVKSLGSPAAIHARLKILREYDWVELKETGDRRRKQVVISASAALYFEQLGKTLHKIAISKKYR
jgi:hypothetical protein